MYKQKSHRAAACQTARFLIVTVAAVGDRLCPFLLIPDRQRGSGVLASTFSVVESLSVLDAVQPLYAVCV